MTSSCDASDVRSPKRQALAPPTDSGRVQLPALDDTVWTYIIEFLPIPDDLRVDDRNNNDTKVSELTATWQTLLSLRLMSRQLATLLHPRRNELLWRRLLLQSFDFTSDEAFNDENGHGFHGLVDPEEGDVHGRDVDDKTQLNEQDPQRVAMRGRYDETPEFCLEEHLECWFKLGIYHRPSQYGFLTTLQQSGEGTWPESENAFTLFGDIVRLLQMPNGDWTDTTKKCLAAPTEAGSNSAFFRFYLMKTLGYVPHIWHRGKGISSVWKGFTQAEAMQAMIHEQLRDAEDQREDPTEAGFQDLKHKFQFPDCTLDEAKRIFRHIQEHFRDWRSVNCSKGSNGYTPKFFVGESNAAPHRWTGYLF